MANYFKKGFRHQPEQDSKSVHLIFSRNDSPSKGGNFYKHAARALAVLSVVQLIVIFVLFDSRNSNHVIQYAVNQYENKPLVSQGLLQQSAVKLTAFSKDKKKPTAVPVHITSNFRKPDHQSEKSPFTDPRDLLHTAKKMTSQVEKVSFLKPESAKRKRENQNEKKTPSDPGRSLSDVKQTGTQLEKKQISESGHLPHGINIAVDEKKTKPISELEHSPYETKNTDNQNNKNPILESEQLPQDTNGAKKSEKQRHKMPFSESERLPPEKKKTDIQNDKKPILESKHLPQDTDGAKLSKNQNNEKLVSELEHLPSESKKTDNQNDKKPISESEKMSQGAKNTDNKVDKKSLSDRGRSPQGIQITGDRSDKKYVQGKTDVMPVIQKAVSQNTKDPVSIKIGSQSQKTHASDPISNGLPVTERQKEKLSLEIPTRNLPFKAEYGDATPAFPNGCPPSLKNWTASNDSFQYFQPMDNQDAWVYSAFWDTVKAAAGQPTIRAFGIARLPLPWRIYCHFHVSPNNRLKFISRPGFMKAFLDSHRTIVRPFAMECKIPQGLHPKTVSFTFKDNTKMTNSLQIQYPGPTRRKFTVCYSAFHSSYNDTSRLIQSIQFNSKLGAEHFVVYNFSISSHTDSILRYYMAKGLVTVLQWPLPTLEAWYLAQMVSINDCLYRNRNTSDFVAFLDTDEFIVPKSQRSWYDMIKTVEKKPHLDEYEKVQEFINLRLKSRPRSHSERQTVHETSSNKTSVVSQSQRTRRSLNGIKDPSQRLSLGTNKTASKQLSQGTPSSSSSSSSSLLSKLNLKIGSFSFRNAFFCNKRNKQVWDAIERNFSISKEEESFLTHFRVYPLTQYYRLDYLFGHRSRSKTIVRPDLVYIAGIHYVHEHVPGARAAYVREDVALLQHYRCYMRHLSNTIDGSAFRLKSLFMNGLKDIFSRFKTLVH